MGRQLFLLGAVVLTGAYGAVLGPWPLREVMGDIIAVFAILAAFLIQVMLLLVTAFNPGSLSAERIKQITDRLTDEQRRASLVFFAYLVAIGSGVVGKAASGSSPGDATAQIALHGLTGVGSAAAAYGLIGSVMLVRSLRAVQHLRHRLMIEEAEASEAGRQRQLLDNVAYISPAAAPSSSFGKRFGP